MKKCFALIVSLLLTGAGLACAQEAEMEGAAEGTPATQVEKVSYSIGLNMGRSLQQQSVEVDVDQLTQGIRDGLSGAEAKMTDEEIQTVMQAFQQEMMQKAQQQQAEAASKNEAEGAEFLAENKEREGVMVTDSGLQYEVLEEGDGPKPSAEDQVTVHYKGTLIDGTVFDSSYDRGQPATFPLNAVIPGWTEGVQLMNVGSKYKLYIPPQLGYGAQGQGPTIGPNATLIFEVELLEIVEEGEGEGAEGGMEGEGGESM